MTIYGDLYFLLNAAVDFVLLLVAGRLDRASAPFWRLGLAALFGACYATAQFWWPSGWAFAAPGVVAASLVMVALAYAPVPPARFLRLCLYLYAGAAFVAGVALAFSFAGGRYRGLPWWALGAALTAALWGVARAHRARLAARSQWLVPVRVAVDGRIAACTGLVDTGNLLHDPLAAGRPVLVMEAGALAGLLPAGLASAPQDLEGVVQAVSGGAWASRLRVIPYRALGTAGGLLVGFRPDGVEVDRRPLTAGVTVGVSGRRLDPEGRYQALVPAVLLEGEGGRRERRPAGAPLRAGRWPVGAPSAASESDADGIPTRRAR